MTGFYKLIDIIKEELKLSPFVNTVTYGDISDIDLSKQTIFPLSHFMVNSFNYGTNVVTFSITLFCMDIIDESKDAPSDLFLGNNNEQDIFNTQMNVIGRLLANIERGQIYVDGFQLVGEPVSEAFTERFDNKLAGWSVTFDVNVMNDIGIC